MLYAVCCMLYSVCCMLYAVCCMLYAVCCMLYAVCCMLYAVCCMLYAVCCMLYAVCCMLYAVCCMLYAVCCMLYAVCCMLYAVCCMLYAVCCITHHYTVLLTGVLSPSLLFYVYLYGENRRRHCNGRCNFFRKVIYIGSFDQSILRMLHSLVNLISTRKARLRRYKIPNITVLISHMLFS